MVVCHIISFDKSCGLNKPCSRIGSHSKGIPGSPYGLELGVGWGGGGLSYVLCLWQSYCSNMSGSGDVGRKGVGGSSPTLS